MDVRIKDRDVGVDQMLAFEVTQGVTSIAVTTASVSREALLLQCLTKNYALKRMFVDGVCIFEKY